jgi:hypothetical protein
MKIALIAAAVLAATPVFASETCPETPKDKWLKPEQVQERLAAQGYDVRRVKAEGTCFEAKARKDGKRVELYVSPGDGRIVREKAKERS